MREGITEEGSRSKRPKRTSSRRQEGATGKSISLHPTADPVVWDDLEGFARQRVQELIQELLEQEVTELLGRAKSKRRGSVGVPAAEDQTTGKRSSTNRLVDGAGGYRNGYGKPRRVSTLIGTLRVRRPRVRGLDERFESRVLPLFARRTKEVGELLPELYLHGLAGGDFELALRGLLGEGAPLSASSIARLKGKWEAEYREWKQRKLSGQRVIYLWVDGIYVKAGLEKEKAALLVVIGALEDGTKAVLAVESGYRESIESWKTILKDLKDRGMNSPELVAGDGSLGIWGAIAEVFPLAKEQRCWNHRIVNLLDKISKKEQPTGRELLKQIPYSATLSEAAKGKVAFQTWAKEKGFTSAAEAIDQDWGRMVTFYSLPKEHWRHLRTTNVVESPFASVRLRTSAAKRYKKVDRATVMIWRLLLVAESRFRKLNAPELLKEVADGATYSNGVRVQSAHKLAA